MTISTGNIYGINSSLYCINNQNNAINIQLSGIYSQSSIIVEGEIESCWYILRLYDMYSHHLHDRRIDLEDNSTKIFGNNNIRAYSNIRVQLVKWHSGSLNVKII